MSLVRDSIKIALSQISCSTGNKTENIRKIEESTKKATEEGAQLVIFPELALTGYVVRDEVYNLAERIPGPSTSALAGVARDTGSHIVFGMPEIAKDSQGTIYNTAVLLGPQGLLGKYRKMYLPTHTVFEEKRYFRQGYQACVSKTGIGKLGLIICYDVFFPEVTRLARLEGAQLIVCISASPATRRDFFEALLTARAIENGSFIAYVNLVGIEDGLQFWGGSRLIAPNGTILAKAKYEEEDLVLADVNYADARPTEIFLPILKDLRPELFELLRERAESV